MVRNLELINYRNISKAKIELSEGLNILVESNGYGKTNFLESIYISVFRKIFRASDTTYDVVGPELQQSRVLIQDDKQNQLEVIFDKENGKTIYKFNSKVAIRKKIQDIFKIVLFAPHSVDLVNGDPTIRRDDIDNHISQIDFEYLNSIAQYKKVLLNRNRVIKMIKEGVLRKDSLDFWTEKISQLCNTIQTKRNDYFNNIRTDIRVVSEELFHDIKDVDIIYNPNLKADIDIYKAYQSKFSENYEKEISVGKTLYGIHKDDFDINFNSGKSIRYFGSRGQQRIASFIIKSAQAFNIKRKTDILPIFLIDDIMSELDDKHRKNIANFLTQNLEQVILTGADINEMPKEIIDNSKRIKL